MAIQAALTFQMSPGWVLDSLLCSPSQDAHLDIPELKIHPELNIDSEQNKSTPGILGGNKSHFLECLEDGEPFQSLDNPFIFKQRKLGRKA